jgi:copper chaperone
MRTNQTEKTYTVSGMSCWHCVVAVSERVGQMAGVESVDVALDTKQVTVRGQDLGDRALRAAIDEAGLRGHVSPVPAVQAGRARRHGGVDARGR